MRARATGSSRMTSAASRCSAHADVGARDHDTEDRKLTNATYNPSRTDSPVACPRPVGEVRPSWREALAVENEVVKDRENVAQLPEAIPTKPPVEVADTPEHAKRLAPTKVHLVRSAATERLVRPVAVVKAQEIGAEAIDFGRALEEPQPDMTEHRLLDGLEHPFDPPVRPGMAGTDQRMLDAVLFEEGLHGRSSKQRRSIGEHALRRAVLSDSTLQHGSDFDGIRPANNALESDEPTAMIVDDADDPDGHDGEHPDERQVDAPELLRLADVDAATAHVAPLGLERHHQVPPPDQDLPEGLASGGEAEHSLGEPTELPGAEVRLLDVQAHDLFLDVVGGLVPGSVPAVVEGRRRKPAEADQPPLVEAAQTTLPVLDATLEAAAVLVDEDGEVEQDADEPEAGGVVRVQDRNPREPIR